MDIEYLNQLRRFEAGQVIERYSPWLVNKHVLEVGSGTGEQLREFAKVAAHAVGIDLADGNYSEYCDARIVKYDGHRIPFEDATFDTVYSSSVLEHVSHRDAFQREIARVLKPGGHCIHLLPGPGWKLTCMLAAVAAFPWRAGRRIAGELVGREPRLPRSGDAWLELLLGARHGEFGNTVTELRELSPRVWEHVFRRNGWRLLDVHPAGLFYSAYGLLKLRISWRARKRLARVFGSTCTVYVLEKAQTAAA